jgi:hypothetical protein
VKQKIIFTALAVLVSTGVANAQKLGPYACAPSDFICEQNNQQMEMLNQQYRQQQQREMLEMQRRMLEEQQIQEMREYELWRQQMLL